MVTHNSKTDFVQPSNCSWKCSSVTRYLSPPERDFFDFARYIEIPVIMYLKHELDWKRNSQKFRNRLMMVALWHSHLSLCSILSDLMLTHSYFWHQKCSSSLKYAVFRIHPWYYLSLSIRMTIIDQNHSGGEISQDSWRPHWNSSIQTLVIT